MKRAAPWLLAALGAALVVAGGAVFAAAERVPRDFGRSAYSPLPAGEIGAYQSVMTFTDGSTVLWTGAHLLGAGLVMAGLLVIAGVGGWLLGLRMAVDGPTERHPPACRPLGVSQPCATWRPERDIRNGSVRNPA